MAFIKCLNCGKTEFEPTVIGDVSSIDGCCFRSTINAYACQNCGHIELFEPHLDQYARHLKNEAHRKKQHDEWEKHFQEEARKTRIEELIAITKDENSTVKQVREANEELDRLHAKPGVIYPFSYR